MAFSFGYAPQTPEGIARKRQIAQALMMQGMDSSPIQSPWQGVNRIAQALVGGYQNRQAEEAATKLQREQEAKAKAEQAAADFEKRNTPDFHEVSGSIYNWNPYMAQDGKPVLLSQAIQKADEWKKLNDGMMYRQGADGQPEYSQVPGAEGAPASEAQAEFTKALNKQRGKDMANMASKINAAALNAKDTIGSMSEMDNLIKDGGFYTGIGAQTTLPYRRALVQVTDGIPVLNHLVRDTPDSIAKAERFQSLSNQAALRVRSPDGGLGMPGALSDGDRKFLQSIVPNLSTSAAGNQLIAQAETLLAKRALEIQNFMNVYIQEHGSLDDQFVSTVTDWAEKNPLFEQLQGAAGAPEADGGGGSAGEAGRTPPPPPQVGEEKDGHVFLGGNPADPKSWRPVQ